MGAIFFAEEIFPITEKEIFAEENFFGYFEEKFLLAGWKFAFHPIA